MKQVFVILIAFCYAFGSSDISMHFHYCGKVFQYVSLFNDKEKDSCCGDTGDKHDCCSSDVVKVDVDDHKQAVKHFYLEKPDVSDAVNYVAEIFLLQSIKASTLYQYSKLHPPPIISTKVYLDNCVFLI